MGSNLSALITDKPEGIDEDSPNTELPTATTPMEDPPEPVTSSRVSPKPKPKRPVKKPARQPVKKTKLDVIIDISDEEDPANEPMPQVSTTQPSQKVPVKTHLTKAGIKLDGEQQSERTPRKTPNKKLMVAAESCRKITEFFTKTPSKTPEKPPTVAESSHEVTEVFPATSSKPPTPPPSATADSDPFQNSPESELVLPPVRRRAQRRLSSSSTELLVPCTNQNIEPPGEPARKRRVTKKTKTLTKSTNLRQVSRKYFGEDQKRMTTFYEKTTEDPVGYLTRIKESGMPAINTGDVNMEDFLHVSVKVEEAGTVQLNDRSLTMEELNERFAAPEGDAAFDPERNNWDNELNVVAVQLKKSDEDVDSDVEVHPTPQKEIIVLSDDDSREPPAPKPVKEVMPKTPAPPPAKALVVKTKTPAPGTRRQKKAVVCPPYKIIAGTTFAVDAFQFGKIEGVSHYFLTHYHADHYMGLTKKFDMPLILSDVTARLVQTFIKIKPELMTIVQLHKPITIDGVEVTALDANQ
jgi:DNA cross-link repair 1A protein